MKIRPPLTEVNSTNLDMHKTLILNELLSPAMQRARWCRERHVPARISSAGSRLLAAIVIAQTNPSGRNSVAIAPSSEAPMRSNTTWPKPLRAGGSTARAAALGQVSATPFVRVARPVDRDRARLDRERAMLGRVGGELVHDQPERLHRLRLQKNLRPLRDDAAAIEPAERRKLDAQQFLQRRALPVVLHQQIVPVGERLDAAAKAAPRNPRCCRCAARSCARAPAPRRACSSCDARVRAA